ncbi:MAG: hypothetical protein RBG13Loki_4220 [Promethearchaeota archaeon CR_4]|nr:MAG: hypothetical protein RBG13Loki_4220 [Candidatus Lokiarchaeota archaeon CR_4]
MAGLTFKHKGAPTILKNIQEQGTSLLKMHRELYGDLIQIPGQRKITFRIDLENWFFNKYSYWFDDSIIL